jgi:hypothetical protein
MGLDIRIPIGGMFSILGLMMFVYGLFTTGDEMYARSLGVNVNLWWGLVMLIFGGLMLFFGVRQKAVPKPASTDETQPPRH